MPGPPPPPPAPAPAAPSSSAQPPSSKGRTDLLKSIEHGAKLKKTKTNDRSGPTVSNNKLSENTSGSNANIAKGTGGPSAAPMGGGMGGLFAGGMPKLKSTAAGTAIGRTTSSDKLGSNPSVATTAHSTKSSPEKKPMPVKQQPVQPHSVPTQSAPKISKPTTHTENVSSSMLSRQPPPVPRQSSKPELPTRSVPPIPSAAGKPEIPSRSSGAPPSAAHRPAPPPRSNPPPAVAVRPEIPSRPSQPFSSTAPTSSSNNHFHAPYSQYSNFSRVDLPSPRPFPPSSSPLKRIYVSGNRTGSTLITAVAKTVPTDLATCESLLTRFQSAMDTAIANQDFQNCIKYKDAMGKLETLKARAIAGQNISAELDKIRAAL